MTNNNVNMRVMNDLKPIFSEASTQSQSTTQQFTLQLQNQQQNVLMRQSTGLNRQDPQNNQQNQESSQSSSEILVASPLIDTCRYCKKQFKEDDLGSVRFQCTVCKDFVLCIDCFLAQISYRRHRPTHKFYVIHSNLDNYYPHNDGFSLYDDLLLIEGIRALGFGSWNKICSFMARPQEQSVLLCKHYYMCLNNDVDIQSTEYNNQEFPNLRGIQWNSQVRFTTQINDFISKNQVQNPSQLQKLIKETLHISAMPSLTRFPPSYCFGQLPAKTGFRAGYMPFRMQLETEYINRAEYAVSCLKINFKESELQLKNKLLMLKIYAQRLYKREIIKQQYWSEYLNFVFKDKRWISQGNFVTYSSTGKVELRFKEKYKREYNEKEKEERLLNHKNEDKISQLEQELTYCLRVFPNRIKIRKYCNQILQEHELRKEIFQLQLAQLFGYKWYSRKILKDLDVFMQNQIFQLPILRNCLPKQIFINTQYNENKQEYEQTLQQAQQLYQQQLITKQQYETIQQYINLSLDKNLPSNQYLSNLLNQNKKSIIQAEKLNIQDIISIIYYIFNKINDSQQQVCCLNKYGSGIFPELIFTQLSIINLPIALSYGLHYIFAYNLYMQQKRIQYNINNIPFSISLLNQVFETLMQRILQENQLTKDFTAQFQLDHFYQQLFSHATDYVSHQDVSQIEQKYFSTWFISSDFYTQNQINPQLFAVSQNWEEYRQQFMVVNKLSEQLFYQIYKEDKFIFDHSIQPAKILSHLCYILSKHKLQYINKDIIYQLIEAYGLNHKLSGYIVDNCQQFNNLEELTYDNSRNNIVQQIIKDQHQFIPYLITDNQYLINETTTYEFNAFQNFTTQQKLAILKLKEISSDNQLFIVQPTQQQEERVTINEQVEMTFTQLQSIKLDDITQDKADMFIDLLSIISDHIIQDINQETKQPIISQDIYEKILIKNFQSLLIKIENDKNMKEISSQYRQLKISEIIGRKHIVNTTDYILGLQTDNQIYIDQRLLGIVLDYYRRQYQLTFRDKLQLFQFLLSLQELILCSIFQIDPTKYSYIKLTLMINNLTTNIQMLNYVNNKPAIIDLIKLIIVRQYKDNSKCVIPVNILQNCIQQFRSQRLMTSYKQFNILQVQKLNIQKDQQSDQYNIKMNVTLTYMDKPIWNKQKFQIQTNQKQFQTFDYIFKQNEYQWRPIVSVSQYFLIAGQLTKLLSGLQIFNHDKQSITEISNDYLSKQEQYDKAKETMAYGQQQQHYHIN